MRKKLINLVISFVVIGRFFQMCSPLDNSTVPIEQIIRVINLDSTKAIAADGLSTVTLRAIIPANAIDRQVIFNTTEGTFDSATGDNKTTVQVNARENDGIAETILTVGTKPTPIKITATAGGHTSNILTVTLTTASIDNLIKLEGVSIPALIKADGKTQITIKATIPVGSKDRQIIFDSSDGYFLEATGADKTILQKQAHETDGITSATLVVGKNPGKLYVTASNGANKSNPFSIDVSALAITDILSITASPQVTADGVSTFTVTAQVSNSPSKTVKLTASPDAGIFLGSGNSNERTVPLDQNGMASLTMRVGTKVGPHQISASVNNDTLSLSKQISYSVSYPESLLVELSASRTDTLAGKSVTITVYFRKTTGVVSFGRKVTLSAYQLIDGQKIPVGRFAYGGNSSSDTDGKVLASFFTDTGGIKSLVPIIILARTPLDATSELVSDPATLAVDKK